MILGFKDRFVPYVLDGSKTHTIRARNRWEVGMRADLFKNVRQKGMTLLFRAPVVRIESILIRCDLTRRPEGWPSADVAPLTAKTVIEIDECCLDKYERELFAFRDGFRDDGPKGHFHEMVQFWRVEHGFGSRITEFKGQIIHWDYAERYIPCADCGRSHPLGPCNARCRTDWNLPKIRRWAVPA